MEKKRWTLKDNMEKNECLVFINRADEIIWLPKKKIRLLALESLYVGQIILSTLSIKANIHSTPPPTQHHSFFRNEPPYLYDEVGRIVED